MATPHVKQGYMYKRIITDKDKWDDQRIIDALKNNCPECLAESGAPCNPLTTKEEYLFNSQWAHVKRALVTPNAKVYIYPCPACGFITFTEPVGSYSICQVCKWEDDASQLEYPDMAIGANGMSLIRYQGIHKHCLPLSIQTHLGWKRDPTWRPLSTEEIKAIRDKKNFTPDTGVEYFKAVVEAEPVYYWRTPEEQDTVTVGTYDIIGNISKIYFQGTSKELADRFIYLENALKEKEQSNDDKSTH